MLALLVRSFARVLGLTAHLLGYQWSLGLTAHLLRYEAVPFTNQSTVRSMPCSKLTEGR
jgi:hypothetical protein